jgi:peptidoglycan hydrolase-like amidase
MGEPQLSVGLIDRASVVRGTLHGRFRCNGTVIESGAFECTPGTSGVRFVSGGATIEGNDIRLVPDDGSPLTVDDIVIGVQFHWERAEPQTFRGGLRILRRTDGSLVPVNEIGLEEYLESVISSEMSAASPKELLRAHAITSRSWLVAMLKRIGASFGPAGWTGQGPGGREIVRWYTREDHDLYDVCADDHCQRYQGITRVVTPEVHAAVSDTRGVLLTHGGQVCDARFHKACGGITEEFQNAWEDVRVPYLTSVSDAPRPFPAIASEGDMAAWTGGSPPAYCNTRDPDIIRRILPSFDQETHDFFRWTVTYRRSELEEIIATRSGIDLGRLKALVPVRRGPSGRLFSLRIVGSRETVTIGKELEIRKWLSRSHLYSGAFVVEATPASDGIPAEFILRGAGWGHGVGLCQIGAAVMADRGQSADAILAHYFRGANLEKLY